MLVVCTCSVIYHTISSEDNENSLKLIDNRILYDLPLTYSYIIIKLTNDYCRKFEKFLCQQNLLIF
jgi:predicted membrane channel-forming protein YqfA (hemolysin III family)